MTTRIPDEEKDTTNAVGASARRSRKTLRDRDDSALGQRNRTRDENEGNVVRLTQRSRDVAAAKTEQPQVSGKNSRKHVRSKQPERGADPGADPRAIPADVRQRFVQVGNGYFFPDGARAFTDRGRKLTTPSENTEVVRSLIAIAQARGWRDVTIEGTERFRKEAWFAAKLVGMEVQGYTPGELEQGQLIRRLARNASSARDSVPMQENQRSREREESAAAAHAKRESLITGRLVDHGQAHYRHRPEGPISYFVRIETPRGEREIWGVDLERAFRESLTRPQVGDVVGLRAIGKEPVTVKSRELGANGELVGERERLAHRNRWLVEQREFFASREQAARTLRDEAIDPREAVKQHPELAGTYLQLRAAELAARRIRDPEDQRTFVATVRRALSDAVARGEPLSPVRLKEQAQEREPQTHAKRTRQREGLARG
jgi:putative DNA primase/helicase